MLKQYPDQFFIRELPSLSDNEHGNIVFIHGLGESGYCFEPLMQHPLFKGWRQFAIDLYGYGKSSWTTHPVSLIAHAEMIGSWLTQHFDEQPIVLVGHSMGGVIGLYICEQFPQLVSAFINIEGNVSKEDCLTSSQVAAFSREDFVSVGFDQLKDKIYRLGEKSPAFRAYYPSLCLCDVNTYYLNSLELVDISEKNEIASRLGQLRCPQIYIFGDPDGTGAYSQNQLAEYNVQCIGVSKSGHWPFIDNLNECAEAMDRFLLEKHL